eukprot:CAMPEP_0114357192 /NCGR_PEP_ID=MMETSP0101-20121206/21460_1 /TAXON_ID=38822 ORGANISM="Pteridomonas danica, Strain PT" /NCGR_SAMPLE_ID=MMETSP0101 /ASSEMBLY_ACC=CAM_ASM_000211 /LENGTH=70 /DNA_ID=CAMNT_0001499867 /DNA_START=359 /DNA_END=571 /DNA_ORIENTATION=-
MVKRTSNLSDQRSTTSNKEADFWGEGEKLTSHHERLPIMRDEADFIPIVETKGSTKQTSRVQKRNPSVKT